jgi:hypothetical protein
MEDDSALVDLVINKLELVFELDTYKLLLKVLNKPKIKIIEF